MTEFAVWFVQALMPAVTIFFSGILAVIVGLKASLGLYRWFLLFSDSRSEVDCGHIRRCR